MSKIAELTDSEDDECGFTVGALKLSEIKDYFSALSTQQYYTAAESSSDSSGELSESFAELLEKRKEEIKMENPSPFVTPSKYLTKRLNSVSVPETPEAEKTVVSKGADETTFLSQKESLWSAGTDESFLEAEKLCEQTAVYHSFMRKQSPGYIPENQKPSFPDLNDSEDETILNDVEPPSILGEQTMMRVTPQKFLGANRPSTILEENTIASSECSFRTASEMIRTNPKISLNSSVSGTSVTTENGEEYTEESASGSNVIELSDESEEAEISNSTEEEIISAPVQCDDITQSQYESLTESQASSFKTEEQESTFNLSREFNDTLEKVEYMMEKGKKLNVQLTPSSGFQQNSPSTGSSSSGGAIKKKMSPTTHSVFLQPRIPSKIPQMKSKNTKFDHIKSPIATYINKTPTLPLCQKFKGPDSRTEAGKSPRTLRTQCMEESKENQAASTNLAPKGTSLFPKKACITTPFADVFDERQNLKVPGGSTMQKLMGTVDPEKTPTILKSMGRYKTARIPREILEKEKRKLSLVEDSVADLSIMSGDVSVHVYKNAQKY
ncbi:hypothetical protein DMENIID0001_146070 [Sergentomyia squamirostris]